MTVINVDTNIETLTLTITCEFEAAVERVWQVWADPRQLERWWGPPTHPATFEEHDLSPGGRVTYYMTGPDGEKYRGWWSVVAVDAPRALEFDDGFADDAGHPNTDLPVTHGRVTLTEVDPGHTRMVVVSTFPSTAAMQQLLDMGMVEGITLSLGQIDALLM